LFCRRVIAWIAEHNAPSRKVAERIVRTGTQTGTYIEIAEGVKEGLEAPDKPVNVNSASKNKLQTLPGVDEETADRIIAGRPYRSKGELGRRGVVSPDEYKEIKDKPVWPVVKSWLSAQQQAWVDEYTPERIELKSGRRAKVTYSADGPPTLAAKIQDLYGTKTLTIAGGLSCKGNLDISGGGNMVQGASSGQCISFVQ
jgi:hypothetical protein